MLGGIKNIPPERDDGSFLRADVPETVGLAETAAERCRDVGVAVGGQAQPLADRVDRVLATCEPPADLAPGHQPIFAPELQADAVEHGDGVVGRRSERPFEIVETEPEVAHPIERMLLGELDHHASPGVLVERAHEWLELRDVVEDVSGDDDVGGLDVG